MLEGASAKEGEGRSCTTSVRRGLGHPAEGEPGECWDERLRGKVPICRFRLPLLCGFISVISSSRLLPVPLVIGPLGDLGGPGTGRASPWHTCGFD